MVGNGLVAGLMRQDNYINMGEDDHVSTDLGKSWSDGAKDKQRKACLLVSRVELEVRFWE